MELTPIIKESFSQYAGAVLQSRALVDARDCLKPSARQIFYCMYTDKFTSNKPFKKTLKSIGSAMRMYIHGDSSCEGVIMRAGQPFSMRYPLVEVEGSYGNLMESGNWAAPRYTASRLSATSNYLFKDIDKNTIEEWRDNYDDTEQYPAVLPSKGYYNIVNPTMGIGVGAATHIPGFNLTEVNKALTYLLFHPDCDFEDIYCAPDFPTGCTLLNEDEVKESLKKGYGKSCKLRATIEYDEKDNCLIVTEIPYGVYTNTICKELELLEEDPHCGIERHNDLTGEHACIKIYLSKRANPSQVIRNLYKKTSLQSHYGINMTMLDKGRFPKIFSWKEALQAHIDHEKEVYRNGFIYDVTKIKNRLHIVEGLLKAISQIDEVVKLIKGAADSKSASIALQRHLNITEIQAKAILDIKLARLAHLEIAKLEQEKQELEAEKNRIETILSNELLFNQEIAKGWEKVAKELGDKRRTKIENIESDDDEEPIERKQMIVHLTNFNNIYVYEDSSLISQRRGGTGSKFKMSDGEMIISTISDSNYNNILMFSNLGKVYNCNLNMIEYGRKIPLSSIIDLADGEYITLMISDRDKTNADFIVFITKNGLIKKTSFSDYNIKKTKGVAAIKLKANDEVIDAFLVTDKDSIGIGTEKGSYLSFSLADVGATGRVTSGVKAISLRPGDKIVKSTIITASSKEILSITKMGMVKKTSLDELPLSNRANKGTIIHKLQDDDTLVSIAAVGPTNEAIIVSSKNSSIKFSLREVRESGKNTIGTKSIKITDGNEVKGIFVE